MKLKMLYEGFEEQDSDWWKAGDPDWHSSLKMPHKRKQPSESSGANLSGMPVFTWNDADNEWIEIGPPRWPELKLNTTEDAEAIDQKINAALGMRPLEPLYEYDGYIGKCRVILGLYNLPYGKRNQVIYVIGPTKISRLNRVFHHSEKYGFPDWAEHDQSSSDEILMSMISVAITGRH